MGIADQFAGQAAHDALRRRRRERPVLAQQACGFQRFLCLLRQPRGLELDAQRQRAPRRALRQRGQAFEGYQRFAVVQCPARCTQLHAFQQFLRL